MIKTYRNTNESAILETFLIKIASLKIFKKYDEYVLNKDVEDYRIRRSIVGDYIKTINPKVDITDSYKMVLSKEGILVSLGDSYVSWYDPEKYDKRGLILMRKKYSNKKTKPTDSVVGTVIERYEKKIPNDSYILWKKNKELITFIGDSKNIQLSGLDLNSEYGPLITFLCGYTTPDNIKTTNLMKKKLDIIEKGQVKKSLYESIMNDIINS